MGTSVTSHYRAIRDSNAKIVEFLGGKLLGAFDMNVQKSLQTECLVAFRYKLRSASNGGLIQSMQEAIECINTSGIAVIRGEIDKGDALIVVSCNRGTLGL